MTNKLTKINDEELEEVLETRSTITKTEILRQKKRIDDLLKLFE